MTLVQASAPLVNESNTFCKESNLDTNNMKHAQYFVCYLSTKSLLWIEQNNKVFIHELN